MCPKLKIHIAEKYGCKQSPLGIPTQEQPGDAQLEKGPPYESNLAL